MIYECASCKRTLVTKADECLEDGTFPPIVSYVAVVQSEDTREGSNLGYCCSECVENHSGLGKFEGNYGRHAKGTALVLYAWMMEGNEDDRMGHEKYCGQFGRYLLYIDYSGFVTYEEFNTITEACKRFDELYSDGMGADENDAYIQYERGKPVVSFDGKILDIWSPQNKRCDYDEGITERRAVARVRLEAMKTGYWPNLWMVSDHGNLILRSY